MLIAARAAAAINVAEKCANVPGKVYQNVGMCVWDESKMNIFTGPEIQPSLHFDVSGGSEKG